MTQTPKHPPELLQKILEALDILKLPQLRHALQGALEAPTANDDRLLWLWRLLEPQLRQRLEGRVERRIRESKLPERKTFEAFNFAFQHNLDRDLIMELATLRFIDQGRNVLLAGMSGTGESHIAKALALTACTANRRVFYTTSADMLSRLNASLADGTLMRVAIKPYLRADLLLVDEVGMEQVERKEAYRSGLMQKVLLPRYHERRSSITSNIPWDAWGEYLDDHLGATAIIDRLLDHSCVIVINGPSYREWEHRQETEAPRAAK